MIDRSGQETNDAERFHVFVYFRLQNKKGFYLLEHIYHSTAT